MAIRWRRILLGAFFVEIIPIAALAVLTAFGPDERDAAVAFAAAAGRWVGPIVGTIAAFAFGRWVARPVAGRGTLHGTLLGTCAALFDLSIVFVAGMPLEWLHVAAAVGRIVGGALGGATLSRHLTSLQPRPGS